LIKDRKNGRLLAGYFLLPGGALQDIDYTLRKSQPFIEA